MDDNAAAKIYNASVEGERRRGRQRARWRSFRQQLYNILRLAIRWGLRDCVVTRSSYCCRMATLFNDNILNLG
uniref:Uncharacterized protein n=1 Tax=Megaselia scalaris TaxID=36166 RepID=T1H3W0_MEGSC